MTSPPSVTLTAPQSPTRARSVSQPIREGAAVEYVGYAPSAHLKPARSTVLRSQSSHIIQRAAAGVSTPHDASSPQNTNNNRAIKGRARSSSLVTVTEVGGDEPENVVDRLGVGTNENAAWVNAPGAWLIHPVLIFLSKVLIDAIPGMTQDVSWTIVNLGYMALSFLMFHHVTGAPFESTMTSGGAYDELTLWEQIDAGAQYTPAKKWLTSVPIGLFLISTHYTRYDYILFALNFAALVFVLFPKLPGVSNFVTHSSDADRSIYQLHRLRFHFLPATTNTDVAPTPISSRPPSPPRVDQGSPR
ncbi:ORMDL family-domain-containing protein [Naematelia encephala]|uniref:ORMDL family-domain-containing protein n=1 Tax=Naematelia encephala TaxID=71784 RepID=A0A1Y2B914_9TREE|nr:ORMDL family-domain-containing protein [Naematelia encephala]